MGKEIDTQNTTTNFIPFGMGLHLMGVLLPCWRGCALFPPPLSPPSIAHFRAPATFLISFGSRIFMSNTQTETCAVPQALSVQWKRHPFHNFNFTHTPKKTTTFWYQDHRLWLLGLQVVGIVKYFLKSFKNAEKSSTHFTDSACTSKPIFFLFCNQLFLWMFFLAPTPMPKRKMANFR